MWSLPTASDQPIDLADDLLVSAAAQHADDLLSTRSAVLTNARLLSGMAGSACAKGRHELGPTRAQGGENAGQDAGLLRRTQNQDQHRDGHHLGEGGGLAEMVQRRCSSGQVDADGAPRQSLVTLGPGLAIALVHKDACRAERGGWAERDAGVRRLADSARREAMCGGEDSEHMLVLLGEPEAGRGAVARALLHRLVARAAARDGPAAEDVLAQRVQLCVRLAAYFTHAAPAGGAAFSSRV